MKRTSLILLLSFMLISGCGGTRKLATTTEFSKADTSTVRKVRIMDYQPMSNLNLGIGHSLELEEAKIKITRIDSTRAVVEAVTEVITKKETRVTLVPTKTVDRSKDKSIKGSTVNSKLKDKSQTDSNNKSKKSDNQKVKANNKQVKRGFHWSLILMAVIILVFGRYLFKKFIGNG